MRSRRTLIGIAILGPCSLLFVCCHHDEEEQDAAPACKLPFLGEAGKPVQLEVTVADGSGVSKPLKDGDRVPLIDPPQGGRVIFIGARATNIDACAVKLSGAIRDPLSKQVRFDNRTINLVPTGDGWGASGEGVISNFSNIPLCPNQWSDQDAFEKEYELTISVADKSGHTATRTLKVTPFCAEPAKLDACLCICKKGYVLGEKCTPADAGPSDAAAEGG